MEAARCINLLTSLGPQLCQTLSASFRTSIFTPRMWSSGRLRLVHVLGLLGVPSYRSFSSEPSVVGILPLLLCPCRPLSTDPIAWPTIAALPKLDRPEAAAATLHIPAEVNMGFYSLPAAC